MRKCRITINAPVTLGFVFACLIVTLLGTLTKGVLTQFLFMTYHSSLLSPLTYVRFFTHVLGHGGMEHFMGNAMYLLLLGPMLEEKYGSKMLLNVIIVVAVTTGVIHYLLFWDSALCGASGVVFAFILMASFTGFREGEIPLSFILVAVIYIGQQIVDGIFIEDNISNMAHIVGGMIGGFVGYILNRRD